MSSFVNHMVDVEMMEAAAARQRASPPAPAPPHPPPPCRKACGEELAERLEKQQPTKVLTVEATGLLPRRADIS